MIYEYSCSICGKKWEAIHAVKHRFDEWHCGHRAVKLIASNVYTDRDLAYKFEANIFGNQPVTIRSKGHYKGLLKSHNMPDASPQECFQEARMKKTSAEIKRSNKRKKFVKQICGDLHKEGIVSRIKHSK